MKFQVKMPKMHRFLCLAMMAMVLLGSSGVVEAMNALIKKAAQEAAEAAGKKAAASASREALEASLKK